MNSQNGGASSSEEPSSYEQPSSNEVLDPTILLPLKPVIIDNIIGKGDSNKILWINNSGWYTLTAQLGYPRPQGNLPMLNSLTPAKQNSLLHAYFSVRGDAADYANQEWKSAVTPYDN